MGWINPDLLRALLVATILAPTAVTFSADAPTFTWTLPTKQISGAALSASDIEKSTMKCGTTPGGPYPLTRDAAGAATSIPAAFALAADGWHYCIVTTTGKGASAGESLPSNELAFFTLAGVVVNPHAPAAPADLRLSP